MGRQLVKQPDGRWAMYSSITDSFILWDATEDEVKKWYVQDAVLKANEQIDNIFDNYKAGRWFGFPPDWEKMRENHNRHCTDQQI